MKTRLPQTFDGLKSDVRAQARDAVIAFLTAIKKQNAEFLKWCIDRYSEKIRSSPNG